MLCIYRIVMHMNGSQSANMLWHEKDVPKDYLSLAISICDKDSVTKLEFLALCKSAMDIVETRKITSEGIANMFIFIASLWLRHDNIDDGSITSDIGGQFAEWEIPGTLDLEHPEYQKLWERMKSWIVIADEQYKEPAE